MNERMTSGPRIITYQDELLADNSVRRTFSDGHYEWRRRLPDGRIEWQDNQGYSGVDEVLSETIIKRSFSNGAVIYGREQGYGRTAWSGGGRVVTVNQSSFGGRVGMILAGVGAGMLLGSIVWPPDSLSAMEEEALREQMRQASSSGGDGGGGAIVVVVGTIAVQAKLASLRTTKKATRAKKAMQMTRAKSGTQVKMIGAMMLAMIGVAIAILVSR